jgi:hypothetical protein
MKPGTRRTSMNFLETLRAQVGGLLRIKSNLYWYDGRGWDDLPGRVCLILDADNRACDAHARTAGADALPALAVLLLIDGTPRWVWVNQADAELIT